MVKKRKPTPSRKEERLAELLEEALNVLEDNCPCGICGPYELAEKIRKELGIGPREEIDLDALG